MKSIRNSVGLGKRGVASGAMALFSMLMILAMAQQSPAVASVNAAPPISTGDTLTVLTSAALVLLMTPGLAFFYAGMVRKKNVMATIMQSFFMIALISVQWVIWGYSLGFGPSKNFFFGGMDWFAKGIAGG